jgi:hypothetical protein
MIFRIALSNLTNIPNLNCSGPIKIYGYIELIAEKGEKDSKGLATAYINRHVGL